MTTNLGTYMLFGVEHHWTLLYWKKHEKRQTQTDWATFSIANVELSDANFHPIVAQLWSGTVPHLQTRFSYATSQSTPTELFTRTVRRLEAEKRKPKELDVGCYAFLVLVVVFAASRWAHRIHTVVAPFVDGNRDTDGLHLLLSRDMVTATKYKFKLLVLVTKRAYAKLPKNWLLLVKSCADSQDLFCSCI